MKHPTNRSMQYFVYIMSSKHKTLYTGFTSNIHRRVAEHTQNRGSRFVAKYNVDRLVYLEEHVSRQAAKAREKQIKGWLRTKKVALVESMNPGWHDLSMQFTSDPSSLRSSG